MPMPVNASIEIYLLHEIERRGGSVVPDGPLYDAVASHFPSLTPAERQLKNVGTGANKWENRVQWVRRKLVQKGELDGSMRGVWTMTQNGRDRLQREWPPQQSPQYGERLYTDRPMSRRSPKGVVPPPVGAQPSALPQTQPAQAEGGRQPPAPPSPPTPMSLEDLIARHLNELKRALSERIGSLSAGQFEEVVAEVLKRLGYSEVRRVGGPGDRNIDVTGSYQAPLVKVGVRVQVKHRRGGPNVGPTDVAAFRDRAGGADHVLLMVTNAEFTDGAKETASEPGRQLVHRIDGKEFINAMVDKRIGAKEGSMGVLGIDEDFWGQF